MTIKTNDLSRGFFAYALNDNRGGCLTMGGVASH